MSEESISFTVKLNKGLYKMLEVMAKDEDMAMTQYMRRLIRDAWAKWAAQKGGISFTIMHEG